RGSVRRLRLSGASERRRLPERHACLTARGAGGSRPDHGGVHRAGAIRIGIVLVSGLSGRARRRIARRSAEQHRHLISAGGGSRHPVGVRRIARRRTARPGESGLGGGWGPGGGAGVGARHGRGRETGVRGFRHRWDSRPRSPAGHAGFDRRSEPMKTLAALIRTQWDRAGALALVIVGLLALLAGWIGMSGAVLTYEQLPYILSGGLFGLSLIMVGTGLWLSADIRDEWRRIDRLEDRLMERRLGEPGRDVRLPDADETP